MVPIIIVMIYASMHQYEEWIEMLHINLNENDIADIGIFIGCWIFTLCVLFIFSILATKPEIYKLSTISKP